MDSINIFEDLYSNLPSGWEEFFLKPNVREFIANTASALEKETNWFPQNYNIFRVFYEVPISKIKVVVLGQDPYSTNNAATGLAFSIPKINKSINSSVANIKKLVNICGFHCDTTHGNLDHWCDQGVFLLNTALTVKANTPLSHVSLWCDFTASLLQYISEARANLVFLLWGSNASLHQKYIANQEKHCLLISSHPSGFSANSRLKTYPSFMTSKCFSKANEYLESQNIDAIDWA